MQTLSYIDSHTGGEPTRTVIAGGPDLGTGSVTERLAILKGQHDWMRRALILEPRGSAWLVGALLLPPTNPSCVTGVIFFNNAGYLGMCGHGLIGVIETLAHLDQIQPGLHWIETPVGRVSAELKSDRSVSVTNVVSYRFRQDVAIEVPGEGRVVGDVAYGGNWFFLVGNEVVVPSDLDRLLTRTRRIQQMLQAEGIRGRDGAEIDHIELFGPPSSPDKADSRNFVLCPGSEYDRSPCGTGTSAKLACLAADGVLPPDSRWRQESIIGSVFEGSYRPVDGGVSPTITGRAHVTGQTQCQLDPADPFGLGIDLGTLA